MPEAEYYPGPESEDANEVSEERARKFAQAFEDLSDMPIRPSKFVPRGEGEPGLSGIRVGDSREATRDDGEIRALHVIKSFLQHRNGKASSIALMECLSAAGFGEKKAGQFLQTACDRGEIISTNNGRYYNLA